MAKLGRPSRPLDVRLMEKIIIPPMCTWEHEDRCWEWVGAKTGAGYGLIWDGKCMVLAHRVMYNLFIDLTFPIRSNDRSIVLDHRCRNKGCVNTFHLQVVSQRENTARGRLCDLKNKTSIYRGVHWDKKSKKWHVQAQLNGKRVYLGRFHNEVEAAAAYQNFLKDNNEF